MIATSRKSPGFTLIELIIVMAILSILAGIGISFWRSTQGRARDLLAMSDADALLIMLVDAYNDRKEIQFDDSGAPVRGEIGTPPFFRLNGGVEALITPGSACNGEDPGFFEAELYNMQGQGSGGDLRSFYIYINESENIMEKSF